MELSSKNSINIDKSLCLYCDKAFSNNVDQENHVERDHKTILCKGKGSRKSERITKNNSSSENSPFPGCFHCNKKTIRADDLDILFQHLLTSHKEVYFGCKCKIRTQDKVSLANHKKNCKIGGGGKSARCSDENVTDSRKSAKKSQIVKNNGDFKCDSLSESEDNVSAAAANHSKTLPTNAIHKKSDRSKLRNHSKIASVNDKGKNKSSSSSSTTSSSSSSIKTGEDEYTIPLTRQKLKEPPTFARLGATQNRSASNKKSQKTNKTASETDIKSIANTSLTTKVHRTKTTKIVNANSHNNPEPVESVLKNELVSTEFDEDFYKNISSNIRLNLDCFVDGKSDRLQNRPVFDHLSDQSLVSYETDQSVTATVYQNEIHEATNFELSTPFPALLTAEQYGFGDSNPNKHKRQITKNSWKWRWDLIKKYKYVNEGGKIVKKVKQITTGLKDLSQLDMWTQLSMRSRYENLNNQNEITAEFDEGLKDTLSTRLIKTQNIEQLNSILDKRLIPEIDIEQLQQTVIKVEPEEKEEVSEHCEMKAGHDDAGIAEPEPFYSMFNLVKTNVASSSKPLLSGEWARPRCYICIDCGLKFDLMKSLNDHKNSEHPYVVSAHYEIVGRENLEQKLYKNLFLPKKALQTSGFARSLSINSDSKSNETNEASTSSDNSSKFFADQKEKECSKCLKTIKYSSDNDIYRHILDCIEDRAWMQAKRRSKYRRSRRKNRKTTRKSRLSIDHKKATSSPSTKDNTEGENSTLSISNPPTPKIDIKSSTATISKTNKIEPLLSEPKTANGKSNESMNIKNFFRVSKTTPALPQKVVVQMLEMPPNNQINSLRSSLRSSSAKRSPISEMSAKNCAASKNEPAKNENVKETHVLNTDVSVKTDAICAEQNVPENSDKKDIELVTDHSKEAISQDILVPLTITTPEKATSDFPLSSPSNSSLISPTSNSNVPKKKKKLNDCIAMLTCKIQEKLGVNFFDKPSAELTFPTEKPLVELIIIEEKPPLEKNSLKEKPPRKLIFPEEKSSMENISPEEKPSVENITPEEKPPVEKVSPEEKPSVKLSPLVAKPSCVSPNSLELQQSPNTEQHPKPSTSFQMESLLKENTFIAPVQDEVIDLSIKKKPKPIGTEVEITIQALRKTENTQKNPINDNSTDTEKLLNHIECVEVPVKIPIVPIPTEPKLETIDSEKVDEETKVEKVINEPSPPALIPLLVEEIVQDDTKIEIQDEPKEIDTVSSEELSKESFKISIPKEKIPNLQEILDQYQVITVHNIKISESERRAFEEQKNRILQILNKSKNLTNKVVNKKNARKAPKRKAAARKSPPKRNGNRKPEAPKAKAEVFKQKPAQTEAEKIEAKIEEVIKTTNRIRCRRLSVVVDPIINLSAFQNKNRKIRLTNNSQQNGFYDLLQASEQIFTTNKPADKTNEEVLPEKPKEEVKPADVVPIETDVIETPIKEPIDSKPLTKSRAAKTNAKVLIEKTKEVAASNPENVSMSKSKTKAPEKAILNEKIQLEEEEVEQSIVVTEEKLVPPLKALPKRAKGKRQNVENIASPIQCLKPLEDVSNDNEKTIENKVKIPPKGKSKAAARKAPPKNIKKVVLPLEEIKVEQSAKTENIKEPEKRRKPVRGKQQTKEENLLDVSFSSDTSNENDIPLSQLIAPAAVAVVVEEVVTNVVENKSVKPFEAVVETKLTEALEIPDEDIKSQITEACTVVKNTVEPLKRTISTIDSIKLLEKAPIQVDPPIDVFDISAEFENELNEKPEKKRAAILAKKPEIKIVEKVLLLEPEVPIEKIIDELPPFLNKTSSTLDLTATSDVDTRKSFDPFTINEDSFFNDDLDNDPSDKINDIVNNIINSSEFQIDSETEKSEIYQTTDKEQNETSCTICKRTFKTAKVLERHLKTSTHMMKVERRHRGIVKLKEREGVKLHPEPIVVQEKAPSPILDETKVFRTKGALKTFDTILNVPLAIESEKPKIVEEIISPIKVIVEPKVEMTREQTFLNANDDKLYYEFKMEKKPEDMTPKDKDQLFDSLFNSLEAKAQEKQISYTPKSNLSRQTSQATPQDSEMESSSTSWDLKHDADIEWEADNTDNVPFANAIKERYPKKFPVKINKSKDTAVSIPTKSLIMGKIFKKHRDSEKQKTPQADAPNNKPGIKNSLDEIFDHLKNTAEIDDKVLTCPSPKTLLKSAGGTFSPNSSNSNDMLETASQSNNNNIYTSKAVRTSPEKDEKKPKVNIINADVQVFHDSMTEDGDDGIGKRKSRRRCAIKAKTFAETWSSDEYEELHDTEDIISIINMIEKREKIELIKKRKQQKSENHLDNAKKPDACTTSDIPVKSDSVIKPSSIMKSSDSTMEKKSVQIAETFSREKVEKKKSVQIQFDDEVQFKPEKAAIKKRRMSTAKDGHKSDDETFTATRDFKTVKPGPSLLKKRRMSCFVPSTTSFDEKPKAKPPVVKSIKEPLRIESETLKAFDRVTENHELKYNKPINAKKSDSEKSFKNQKKFANLLSNFGGHQLAKKKVQKHRKRPRNKVKNIAYDSDSDFELNLNKKSKASAISEISSSEDDDADESDDVIVTPKPTKSHTIINASRSSNTNDMTMIKEPKLLPNDLKHVVPATTTFKAAIPEDIIDPSQNACNRTKRHSSEKLYYWSSSSSESDQEQGDTADGDNEDSVLPHQPEQHGWIVGDSHKKLVTLLAHAKIKNKIN